MDGGSQAGRGVDEKTQIIGDLPDAGQHEDRTWAFGPDGRLHLSVGRTAALKAMQGHVLFRGEIVGLYGKP